MPAHRSPAFAALLTSLESRIETAPAKTLLQTEDDPVRRPRYVLSGWACRFRHLPDGRRQVFSLVLPGDGVGVHLRANPLAMTNTIALTRMELADASELMRAAAADGLPELTSALQAALDAEERRALDHIVRLGRLTALERTAHLVLELYDRLEEVGLAANNHFALPLTQEALADLLGLSVVHVNRTLQELRRQQLIRLDRGECWITNRPAVCQLVDYARRELKTDA